jgi:superfamily II DNA or RNA helicase
VVLAAGLGKTWLSAFDVKQFDAKRVLFLAHREEILLQAQQTFQRLNPEIRSGLFTGQQQIWSDWMFASIQTISKSKTLQAFSPEHFDYMIVDEFHHATAPTYRRVIDYFQPKFLLGLTATPERTDQADLLALCDDNLVFEKTLRDAILDKELVPFAYFGVKDEFINYEEIPWRNGKFEPTALEHAFASHKRAQHALNQWVEKKQSRTLSFSKHLYFLLKQHLLLPL